MKKINKAGQTYKDFDLKSKTTISIGGKAKYFVQIGAYSKQENAEKQLQKAKDASFTDAFIKEI